MPLLLAFKSSTPYLWATLTLFLYHALHRHYMNLGLLEDLRVYYERKAYERRMKGLEDRRAGMEGDVGGEDEEGEDEGEGEGRSPAGRERERERERGPDPEDGIPLEILATLATCPTYDIREAATKILATRFVTRLTPPKIDHLTALTKAYWSTSTNTNTHTNPDTTSSSPPTPTHTAAIHLLNLLRRYNLAEDITISTDSATATSPKREERAIRFGEPGATSLEVRERCDGVVEASREGPPMLPLPGTREAEILAGMTWEMIDGGVWTGGPAGEWEDEGEGEGEGSAGAGAGGGGDSGGGGGGLDEVLPALLEGEGGVAREGVWGPFGEEVAEERVEEVGRMEEVLG